MGTHVPSLGTAGRRMTHWFILAPNLLLKTDHVSGDAGGTRDVSWTQPLGAHRL